MMCLLKILRTEKSTKEKINLIVILQPRNITVITIIVYRIQYFMYYMSSYITGPNKTQIQLAYMLTIKWKSINTVYLP